VMVPSSTFGPIVGGYLTHQFGWRSIFLINLPLGLIALLLTLRLEQRPAREPTWRFDTFGLLLFIGFVGPTLLALEQLQSMRPGALPSFLALAGLGLAALSALIGPGTARRAPPAADRTTAPAHHLAQRRAGGLPWRGPRIPHRLSADLSIRGAILIARRDRPALAAADDWHRHWLDGHRPCRKPHRA